MLLMLAIFSAASAAPMELTHSGRLLDTNGIPLDGDYSVTVSLYPDDSTTSTLWTQAYDGTAQSLIAFDNGYFSVALGGAVGNPLDTSVFDGTTRYIGLSVDGSPELGRQAIVSVPYAIQATTARNLDGGSVDASEVRVNGKLIVDSNGAMVASDALGGLSCSAGEAAVFDGGAWACTSMSWANLAGVPPDLTDGDDDLLATTSCGMGEVLAYDGVSWACATDLDTTYTAGGGLSLTGDSFGIATGGVVTDMITDGAITVPKTDFTPRLAVGAALMGTWSGSQNSVAFGARDVITADLRAYALRQNTSNAGSPGRTILNSAEEIHFRIGDATVARFNNSGNLVLSGGNVNLATNKIVNLADPTNAQDAATKAYVDTVAASVGVSDGSGIRSPSTTCLQLHSDYPALPSGPYWLGTPGDARLAWCEMTIDGGGWTVIANNDNTDPEPQGCYARIASDASLACGTISERTDFSVQADGWNFSELVWGVYSGRFDALSSYQYMTWVAAQTIPTSTGNWHRTADASEQVLADYPSLPAVHCTLSSYPTTLAAVGNVTPARGGAGSDYDPGTITLFTALADFSQGQMSFTDSLAASTSLYGLDDFQDGWGCGDQWVPQADRGKSSFIMIR